MPRFLLMSRQRQPSLRYALLRLITRCFIAFLAPRHFAILFDAAFLTRFAATPDAAATRHVSIDIIDAAIFIDTILIRT